MTLLKPSQAALPSYVIGTKSIPSLDYFLLKQATSPSNRSSRSILVQLSTLKPYKSIIALRLQYFQNSSAVVIRTLSPNVGYSLSLFYTVKVYTLESVKFVRSSERYRITVFSTLPFNGQYFARLSISKYTYFLASATNTAVSLTSFGIISYT